MQPGQRRMVAMFRSSQRAHFAVWICTIWNSSGLDEQSIIERWVEPVPGVLGGGFEGPRLGVVLVGFGVDILVARGWVVGGRGRWVVL